MRQLVRRLANQAWRQLIEFCSASSGRGKSGQEVVEYALIAGFMAVTIAAIIPYQVTAPMAYIFKKIQTLLVTVGGA